MTETVQKNLDLMMEELHEMKRLKLFTNEEVGEILNRRREFENKVRALAKELQHYTKYITYETTLLKTLRLRRDKKQMYEKQGSIENKIIKRIKSLYETASQEFPHNVDLFRSLLKFCKLVNDVSAATDTVANMIKRNSENPEIWHIAANWHAYECKDLNTAIVTLSKGLEIHQNSQLLYKEIIAIKLLNCVNKSLTPEDMPILTLYLTKFEELINSVFQVIHNYEFYIQVLNDLEKWEFTVKIQKCIVDFLLRNYSHDEKVWHALAQRELRVLYHLSSSQLNERVEDERLHYDVEEPATNKLRTPRARLIACFAKYREGLSKVDATNKPKLWLLFLDFLLELQQSTHGSGTVLKKETFKTALKDASEENCLLERHYLSWIELANKEDDLEIAEKGTAAFPSSVELWLTYLSLQIKTKDTLKINQVFKLGIEALKEKALPLWLSIISYHCHCFNSSDELIELIYKDGIKQPKEVSAVLKPKYIHWLVFSKSIEVAREVYSELAIKKPYCKELHEEMSKLESLEMEYDYVAWEKVHVLATEQFGESDVDVWINYIQFHVLFYKKSSEANKILVQRIYKKAREKLPQMLCIDFMDRYKKMKPV